MMIRFSIQQKPLRIIIRTKLFYRLVVHPSNKPSIAPSYITVTELPGARASEEQIARLFSRYHLALKYCVGKDVLEVACGSGIGLGYLGKFARAVVGGDIDEDILQFAVMHYNKRSGIEIRRLNAEKLPFNNDSFDVAILFEANHPEAHIAFCRAGVDLQDFEVQRLGFLIHSGPVVCDASSVPRSAERGIGGRSVLE